MTDADAIEEELVAEIAENVSEAGLLVACAESLTAGQIATRLGAGEGASEWFAGGIVAYRSEVKFDVLGVTPGPVVTADAALQMVRGVAQLLGADFAVAVTGAGGPEPQDGQPVGTVFIAVRTPAGDAVDRFDFDGEPEEIVRSTVRAALGMLVESLRPTQVPG
jgi:nicotinamide-nucleotide amidase